MRPTDDVLYKPAIGKVKIKSTKAHSADSDHIYDTINPYCSITLPSTTTTPSYAAVNALHNVIRDDPVQLESNVAYDTVKIEDNVAYRAVNETSRQLNRRMMPLPPPP